MKTSHKAMNLVARSRLDKEYFEWLNKITVLVIYFI